MQAKRFSRTNEATVGSGASVVLGTITNNQSRKANFHGIRASGRIRADNVTSDNEAHGLIVIWCKNAEFTIVENQIDGTSELEEFSDQVVAVLPWAVFGGSTTPNQFGAIFDFDINIGKTSRTCTRGQELELACYSMAESSKSVVVMHSLLSCFETIT